MPIKDLFGVPKGPIPDRWYKFNMIPKGVASDPVKAAAPVVDLAYWRRIGHSNMMEVMWTYRHSGGGGSAGSGNYLYPVPNNETIDITMQPGYIYSSDNSHIGLPVVGQSFMSDGSGNNLPGVVYIGSNNKYLMLTIRTNDTTDSPQADSNQAFNQATLNISFKATFPIAGWESQ